MCDAIFACLFQRHNIYHITSDVKHMEMIEKRNDGEKFYNDCEMDKQSLKMGWKEGWMGIFIGEWKTSGTHSASKRWRSTAAAPISVSGGPDARESIIRFHIFFFSLCIFSPIFLPPPSLSVLPFTNVATTEQIFASLLSNSIALERIYFTGSFGRAVIVQF